MNADLAEIQKNIRDLSERHRALTKEAAAIFARKPGFAPEPLYDDHTRAVRLHALELLDGSAPDGLRLPPVVSRQEEIDIQREGIAIALKVLATREADALQREAEAWVAAHTDEWRELAKQTVLAAVRLHALEERARGLLDIGLKGQWVRGLALAQHIGHGVSLLGIGDPLRQIKADALAEDVISHADVRKAENVEF